MKKLLLLVLSMGLLFGINGGDCPATSICFVNQSTITPMSKMKLSLGGDKVLHESKMSLQEIKISLKEELKIDDLKEATSFNLLSYNSEEGSVIESHTITPGTTYTITDKKEKKEGKDVFRLQVWSP